jgi:hypothetical protein
MKLSIYVDLTERHEHLLFFARDMQINEVGFAGYIGNKIN